MNSEKEKKITDVPYSPPNRDLAGIQINITLKENAEIKEVKEKLMNKKIINRVREDEKKEYDLQAWLSESLEELVEKDKIDKANEKLEELGLEKIKGIDSWQIRPFVWAESGLKEKFMVGLFNFSVHQKHKVRVKEVIKKYNKEINWEFSEKESNGGKVVILRLATSNESVRGFEKKKSLFMGLIEDIYESMKKRMTQATIKKYKYSSIGVAAGSDFLLDIKGVDIDEETTYYYSKKYNNHLHILGDINKIIKIGKSYPKAIRKIYGKNLQDFYEENVKVLRKTFVKKDRLKSAKKIVEMIEEGSNINKLPYKQDKFRITLPF